MAPGDAPDAPAGLLGAAVDIGRRLPERPGVSGAVGVVVTGTTEGDRHATLVWEMGRVVAARVGLPAEADVTFTLADADAGAVLAGELGPSVAYMQGRLKTAGDSGLVLGVLGVLGTGDGTPMAAWVHAVRGSAG